MGLDTAIHFLLITALFVTSAKVFIIAMRHLRIKQQERYIHKRKTIVTQLYSGINPMQVSMEHRAANNIQNENYTYGETLYTPFAELLFRVQPKAGEIFYDLGCGAGKSVFTVAALYDQLEIHGVEILQPLYTLCEELLQQYKKSPGVFKSTSITFHQEDFLTHDFSSANIVFINATSLDRISWAKLVKKFETLPKGARVIVSTKTIPSKLFKEQFAGMILMSWGHSSVRIYKKVE